MKFALCCLLFALSVFAGSCKSSDTAEGSNSAVESTEAGTPPKPTGPAYLLRMVDYKSGAKMELVNPAHTTAIDQYSKVRADAGRKVTSEEWMAGLLEFFEDQGWSEEVQSGTAPKLAQGVLRWSLEMTGPKGTSYIAEPMDAKGSQRTRLRTMQKAFLDTFNATLGLQAVKVQGLPFKTPDMPPPKKGGR